MGTHLPCCLNLLLSSSSFLLLLSLAAAFLAHSNVAAAADLTSLFHTGSPSNLVQFADGGQEIHLALDQKNASGFQSYDAYLFGSFNMRIKLVPGDSAGTVTTYYFSSLGAKHDELDFEFLGNVSGQPIELQTNVYASGDGGREQRIVLWFDPAADFHNYSVLWNRHQVVFYVDDTPVRVFPNVEAETGVPYLRSQAMNVYATIWDGDSWATEGGRVKIDWDHAPFVASYRDFSADACTSSASTADADAVPLAVRCAAAKWWDQALYQALDSRQLTKLKWVQDNIMVYNYCTDYARYNVTPPECLHNTPISVDAVAAPATSPSSPSSSPSSPSSSSLPDSAASSPAPSLPHSFAPLSLAAAAGARLFPFITLFAALPFLST